MPVVLAFCIGLASEPVVAQPLEWIFGAPGPRYPRARRAYQPRQQTQPSIPLPVPRPHFPSDQATPAPARSEPKSEPPKDANPAPSPSTVPTPSKETGAEKTPDAQTKPSEIHPERAGPDQPQPTPPTPPPKPPELATPGPAPKPAIAPSGATTAFNPRQAADDPLCPGRLSARLVGADPIDVGKQPDDRCVVAAPTQLVDLKTADGATVKFPDKPRLACVTADAFSAFVRDLLVPLAKGTYGSPVASVSTGPGLDCRSRDHIFGAKLSAHGQGLAVDIAEMRLADGRVIAVGQPKSDTDQAFETAARAAGCGYFHTALGPGTDSFHATHWHFDLEPRGSSGDSKYCK